MSETAPSKISQIIDWIYLRLAEALPEHKELLNPDDIDENPANILAKGYGLNVLEAENTERCMRDNEYYLRRNFEIILTRDIQAQKGDADLRKKRLKLVLEDMHNAFKEITGNRVSISADGEQLAYDFKFVRDSGPRATFIQGHPYVFIELTVSAEYREPIS